MSSYLFVILFFLNFVSKSSSFHFNQTARKFVSTLAGLTIYYPNVILPNYAFIDSAKASPVQSGSFSKTYVQTNNNNIYFFGGLTKESSKSLKDALQELINTSLLFENQFKTKSPPINLHIQSEGGSLLHSMYIVDMIHNSPITINTYVDGFAASAATLLSVSGHKRFMSENSLMLIHQLSSSSSGKYNELTDDMDNFNTFMDIIKKIYYKHSKITPNELNELLKHDLWLNSQKSLEYGLVDEITK